MALWEKTVGVDHVLSPALVILNDEGGFVVTVDFLTLILIEFHRRAEPAKPRLAAYSYVVHSHGDSASSSVCVVFNAMVYQR